MIVPGILLAVILLMTGPIVLFNVRVVGQIAYYFSPDWDLNVLEKQLKYVAKEVKYDAHGQRINPNAKPPWVTAVVVLVVIVILFFVGNFVSHKMFQKTFPSGLFGGGGDAAVVTKLSRAAAWLEKVTLSNPPPRRGISILPPEQLTDAHPKPHTVPETLSTKKSEKERDAPNLVPSMKFKPAFGKLPVPSNTPSI